MLPIAGRVFGPTGELVLGSVKRDSFPHFWLRLQGTSSVHIHAIMTNPSLVDPQELEAAVGRWHSVLDAALGPRGFSAKEIKSMAVDKALEEIRAQ